LLDSLGPFFRINSKCRMAELLKQICLEQQSRIRTLVRVVRDLLKLVYRNQQGVIINTLSLHKQLYTEGLIDEYGEDDAYEGRWVVELNSIPSFRFFFSESRHLL
jgi:hypothetical protein